MKCVFRAEISLITYHSNVSNLLQIAHFKYRYVVRPYGVILIIIINIYLVRQLTATHAEKANYVSNVYRHIKPLKRKAYLA